MNKRILTILSFVLALVMFIGVVSSCGNFDSPQNETVAPETNAPETGAPVTNAPETNAPETNAPETNAPETNAPETNAPETNAPETGAPETNAPETNAPETGAPETNAPETNAPETNSPETNAPETNAPETNAPETNSPETNAPETNAPETSAPDTEPELETIPENEQITLPEDDEEPEETTVSKSDMDIIDLSNKLANGSYPYYTDATRNELLITNQNMNLGYYMTPALGNMTVSHLSTKDGHAYITNTMDVFVRMRNGSVFYAGKSANSQATLNIYRYGYYFYENRLEGQTFVNSAGKLNEKDIAARIDIDASHDVDNIEKIDNGVRYTITGGDPYIVFNGINFDTSKYDTIQVTIKAPQITVASEIYIIAGGSSNFNSSQVKSFGLINDNEAHTYQIPISSISNYSGKLLGLRLDINCAVGTTVEISDISIFKLDTSNSPADLKLQRSFLTYSNKLHHLFQVSTFKDVENIQVFGMETKIDADTVAKYVIKDRNGLHYNTLNKIHWSSVEYVGFDIKDAGIFGYILPYDGSGGTLKISYANGVYTIEQTKGVPGGILTPSCYYNPELPAQSGRYEVIKPNNGNDFFLGQRIYTDTNHTFEKFIYEAECEVNPLTEENVKVDIYTDNASFAGYQPLYGYYKFNVAGTGFNQPFYKHPNKHYEVNFTVTGDKYDRQMYFMSYTTSGQLECAVLLDTNKMLLPVPMEVAKNFVGDGENNIFNNEDRAYGEAYFPMIVKSGETRGYTIVNLYQNWGNVPLKQLSSIQFHTPYYHLSTGVTETNCIVPYAVAGPGLPDFRGMSAPHWKSQPQHTSGGGHSFLTYNDANGGYNPSDTTGVRIDSYGPTYAEIALDYLTADGKIKATYTHMEMPQTDENRSYYTLRYEVLEDTKINDFKNNFRFYYCTDNNSTGVYKKVGYLDVENNPQVVDAATGNEKFAYVLGDDCPYFSFFMMPDWMRDNPHAEGYTNLAFLIYDYKIIINGQPVETNFYLRNSKNTLNLSLNLEDVELKKGDTFSIDAILMPWGSQELEDDPANRYNQSHIPENFHGYTYSSVLPDGTLYMDKNVRDVRENTLLNPVKATAVKDCTEIQSVFIPKLKTTNGKSAEFTISGGHNNIAVRVYGFDMLTAPKLEEFVDGEWNTVDLSSGENPDMYGYAYYYDGYMVNYDGDGTYSYSFVIAMGNGAARTFRLSADEEFKGWPEIVVEDDTIEDPIKFFMQPSEILKKTVTVSGIAGALISRNRDYVALSGFSSSQETYTHFFQNDAENPIVSGQYAVIKYRLPTGISKFSNFEIFASTTTTAATGEGDRLEFTAHTDDQWHITIIDLSTLPEVKANSDGTYSLNFVRWDFLNGKVSSDMYIDIAYFGVHDDLNEIYAMELDKTKVPTETPKIIELIVDGKTTNIDPTTGKEYVPIYVDPENEQGYKVSDVDYFAWIDYINRANNSFGMYNGNSLPEHANPTKKTIGDGLLVLTGWVVAEGGIDKYVWSADGGKTWHDVVLYNDIPLSSASEVMFKTYKFRKGYSTFVPNIDGEETVITALDPNTDYKTNGSFHGGAGICADLANYFEQGEIVNVTFAAVPKADTSSLCLIGYITNVEVYVAPPIEPSETVNKVITPQDIKDQFTNNPKNHIGISGMEISPDGDYVRINSVAGKGDSYTTVMTGNTQHTGQYLFIKYRIPTGYSSLSYFQVFTSTVNTHFQSGDSFNFNVTQDGEWHVIIVDVSQKLAANKFGKNNEGRYLAKYLRIDVFDAAPSDGMYVDIAAAGFADNLDVIYKEICSDMDYVTVVGSSTNKIDPTTGESYVPVYIDPTNVQGYTKSDVEFAGYVDMINGKGGNGGNNAAIQTSINHTKPTLEFGDHSGTTLPDTQLLTFSGWVVLNGGIEKYVWSADGGKTWNDVVFYKNSGAATAGAAHLDALKNLGVTITDEAATKPNSVFQGGAGGGASTAGIAADLSGYAGQKVNVTFAAVSKAEKNGLCILVHVTNIQVPVIEEPAN